MGSRGAPDLSWFEREFLKDNTGALPTGARLERMNIVVLIEGMVLAKPAPGYVMIDMSGMPDRELLNALSSPDSDSAGAELVKRANAKCHTVRDYLEAVVTRK